ncbi:MAG: hypothetical protein HY976_03075 [Candidatus Kerfeldbacteria bacterium]|nr:hypothetical protein [Candidatus Kerfeldbacteria bacterium]
MELRQHHLKGFTTFEVLIVIGMIGLLSALGVAGYVRAHQRASLTAQTERVATVLRQAQGNAQTAVKGRVWGVRCTGSTLERYSVDGAVTATDVQYQLASPVRCSGTFEVRFAKLTGRPSDNVDFIVTDDATSKKVTVQKAGTIVAQ